MSEIHLRLYRFSSGLMLSRLQLISFVVTSRIDLCQHLKILVKCTYVQDFAFLIFACIFSCDIEFNIII